MIITIALLQALGSGLVALILSGIVWVLFWAMAHTGGKMTITMVPPIIVAVAVFCFTLSDKLSSFACPAV